MARDSRPRPASPGYTCLASSLPNAYGMSSFGTYLIGFIILIVGARGRRLPANVPPIWIGVGVAGVIGIGILMATTRTKPRDPPTSEQPV